MLEFPIMYMNSTFVDWGKGGYFRTEERLPQMILRRADFFVLCTDDLFNNDLNDFRE